MGEWKMVKLGDVFSRFSSGKNITAKTINDVGKYPVFGGNGLRGYTNQCNFSGDCAIIGRQGAYCGNVRYFSGNAYMTEHAIVAVANDNNCTRFLAYLLGTLNLGRFSGQSAQPGLSVSELCKQDIIVPPLPIQRKISAILTSLDAKIENNRAVNHHLEQIAQVIFKSWFVDFEPWGGKMPNDWKMGTLGDCLATIESGTRPKGGAESEGVPSIGAENIERFGCYDYSKEKYVSRAFYRQMKRGIVKSGDVLLYKDGAYTGKVSMALDGFPHTECAVNEHVFILRTNDNFLTQFYLYFWLCLDESKNRLFAMASSKAAQPGLNQNEVQSLSVLIPNINVVRKFNEIVNSIMYAIAHNAIENRYLAETRDALLPRLMSGEISVSEAEGFAVK